MAPTKHAQKLRRAAERKGKAEDQYQLALLFFHGEEGLKRDVGKQGCRPGSRESSRGPRLPVPRRQGCGAGRRSGCGVVGERRGGGRRSFPVQPRPGIHERQLRPPQERALREDPHDGRRQARRRQGYRRSEAAPRLRGMRRPRRPPHVPGLPVRYGHKHGPLLHPRVPGGALEGPRAPLRSLPVPPLQVERRLPGVNTQRPQHSPHRSD
jgi:hypothetical protein